VVRARTLILGGNMYIIDEKDKEYRFGDSGPKYLVQGPRLNFALVQFHPGQDFQAHYHSVMEENFYILEGNITIFVDGVPHNLSAGQLIHIEPNEVHYVINRSSSVVRMIASLAPYQESDKVEVDNPQC
jgi:quercetin dioxygenase-like cupin family protein